RAGLTRPAGRRRGRPGQPFRRRADRRRRPRAREGGDAGRSRARDGAPDAARASDHGDEVLRADVAVGDRQAARHQPDARLASSARGAGAAPQVRAGGVHGLMPLLDEEAPRDPLVLFDRWFREAADAGAPQPDAMTLATASDEGPSARMVL